MESTNDVFSFKNVLAKLPRGEPLGTMSLQQYGVSTFRASALARSGWLTHLARGVYMLPGDTLSRDACLAFLSNQVTGLHVGGKTALGLRGVRHNVAFREVLSLWGDRVKPLPAWFTQRFECRYQSTQLFDADLPKGFALQSLPAGRPDVLVSTPERALLELLSDVGKGQSLDEARHLVEALRSVRNDVLDKLLTHTTRIKVVRLAHAIALELELPWAPLAALQSQRLGGGKRWIAVSKSGERLDLKGV
ncbi:MAG TPA: hypothetical protein DCP03_08930 [Polaromonas sp.]|uniref:type IV toxin-antitoxin system AbiEi family antitoxin domain-containing protein n=1 Tax=Polaromonas sp. UBA4122 TaxID=1947074 RepID=UPI000ED995E9|nr:type IV toxin-antitoxin system AbiEi family antitoxin domain-containing protein [Polaromonas sp. UBA4122]HAL38221.1 hypothetical protein [Polaromonas sp.]